MSMKGDLPGLSNFGPGTIGSCQYSGLRPSAAADAESDAPAATAADISAFMRHIATP